MEVDLRRIILHTKKDKYRAKRLSLVKALEMIDCDYILQSHKSFAVNINFINKIEAVSSKLWEICFNNCKEKALLSYNFKESVMKKFKKL